MTRALPRTPARRRTSAFVLTAGAVLGLLAITVLPAAASAFTNPSEHTAGVEVTMPADDVVRAGSAGDDARAALTEAAATVADAQSSGLDLGTESIAIDTADLLRTTNQVTDLESPSALQFSTLMVTIDTQTESAVAQSAALRARLDTAIAQKAAADAAAAAAAAALAAANTPDGAKSAARQIAADEFGWGGDQFSCLSSLWQKESGWNYQAYNPSGATGIPQSLPGTKMASAGSDWQTNATTQIRWGLDYIKRAYGSPCSAWGHSQSMNWY